MTSDAVAAELAAADVLVAPSVPTRGGKREGIPVVLMEAMAAGVPVVASHLSGIPELVTDDVTGLLVPPGDDAALADALERLAADPDLRRTLGAAGRRPSSATSTSTATRPPGRADPAIARRAATGDRGGTGSVVGRRYGRESVG